LDGLRGLLALWVAVSHILCWTGIADVAWRLPNTLKEGWYVVIYAQAAVDTFIILSGFVISFLVVKFKDSYKAFMTNRAFRIYPVYLLCLILSVATAGIPSQIVDSVAWSNTSYFPALRSIAQSEQTHPIEHIALHLSLLNGLIPKELLSNSTATFLAPAWSITLEWQYYLLAPLIAKIAVTSRGAIALLLICLAGLAAAPRWTNPHLAFLPSQLPLFLVGITTYHFFRTGSPRYKFTSMQIQYAIVVLCCVVILVHWHATALTIWFLTSGALVAGVSGDRSMLKWLSDALRSNPLQNLGKLSYPLYLSHWPLISVFLYIITQAFPGIGSGSAAALMLIIGLPLIIAISHQLHKFIELPGIALGRQLTSAMSKRASGAEA
jgi:peptidoglycan/LPS O-acetylase OafA/YrhL